METFLCVEFVKGKKMRAHYPATITLHLLHVIMNKWVQKKKKTSAIFTNAKLLIIEVCQCCGAQPCAQW
jgi:ribosome biogenesis protein Nip4